VQQVHQVLGLERDQPVKGGQLAQLVLQAQRVMHPKQVQLVLQVGQA